MSIADFIAKEYNKLVNYARKHFAESGGVSAEDIVHDVALNIFSKVDFDSAIKSVSAYIYSAIRNRIIDQYRKRNRTELFDTELNETDDMETSGNIIQNDLETTEQIERVYDAISKLPEDYRRIIYATEFDETTFAELSREWDVPIGTLLARKHRAMAKLQKILKDEIN